MPVVSITAGSTDPVPAFDRPQPVVVVGPRPLEVAIAGGPAGAGAGSAGGSGGTGGGTGGGPAPRKPEAWTPFLQRNVQAAVGGLERADVGAARNQAMPAVEEGAKAAASGLARIGPVGVAAAAGLVVAVGSVKAFTSTVDAFVNRGRELAGVNANLAAASAQADVARLRADIREADRLGPQMAKLIETQTRLELATRSLLEPIKDFVLRVLNKFIETALEVGAGMLSVLNDILQAVTLGLKRSDAIDKIIAEIRNILKGAKDPAADDLLMPLLDDLRRAVAPPVVDRAPAPAPLAPLVVGGF